MSNGICDLGILNGYASQIATIWNLIRSKPVFNTAAWNFGGTAQSILNWTDGGPPATLGKLAFSSDTPGGVKGDSVLAMLQIFIAPNYFYFQDAGGSPFTAASLRAQAGLPAQWVDVAGGAPPSDAVFRNAAARAVPFLDQAIDWDVNTAADGMRGQWYDERAANFPFGSVVGNDYGIRVRFDAVSGTWIPEAGNGSVDLLDSTLAPPNHTAAEHNPEITISPSLNVLQFAWWWTEVQAILNQLTTPVP